MYVYKHNSMFLHSGTRRNCVFSYVFSLLLELSTIRTENKLACNMYCGCFSTGDQELKPHLFFEDEQSVIPHLYGEN